MRPLEGQLDEIGGLGLFSSRLDETKPHGRGVDQQLQVDRGEAEPVSEELDDVVVPDMPVRVAHPVWG